MTHPTERRVARQPWHEGHESWSILRILVPFMFHGPGRGWDIIDDLVETEEFGGLWWW
ncbi:MAG: hypothetical protein AAF841_08390 [Pseudomonadota bacterium]